MIIMYICKTLNGHDHDVRHIDQLAKLTRIDTGMDIKDIDIAK